MTIDKIKPVTDETFDRDVIRSVKPVVVDFWAPWCGPCKMITPILEKLAEKHADAIRFFSMNVDENRKKPAEYAVRSIPTLLFFKGGRVQNQMIGAQTEEKIEEALRDLL